MGPDMSGVNLNTFRLHIIVLDLEAYLDSKRVKWGRPCDSVTLHIHGSKADWHNRGALRAHGALPADHPNRKICLVRNLTSLCHSLPQRFGGDTSQSFARLDNDALITDREITLVTKRAAANSGLNPDLRSIHSLRAWGGNCPV